ncbi:CLUMA_CG018847, isoform A [Clunio marinus]|uniref:CLUMA_CG018847, isoform A n=1 Tax=Clunio marinus TaxID=568069 RepID=A0A1J1J224_9DIPT|nr:CLUMA_CG018847, isoform A [Clunio marinus]
MKSMVLHWSIFTLSTQLILCASIYSNIDTIPLNDRLLTPTRNEIFCNSQEQDKFLPDRGPESTLLMDLDPGKSMSSCKRFFTAPDSTGLFIRLIRLNNSAHDAIRNFRRHNITEYCPISITPLGDEHQSPWRFDPCQMEANDEPTKILQGRVKILWVHGSNHPNYKLSVTVVSKNDACRDRSKHACLKFGDEPLLCISDDLICDGIRQCPTGSGMLDDEDVQMCRQHRFDDQDLRNNNFQKSSIWQHLTLGIFQNIFGSIESTSAMAALNPLPSHPDTDVRPTLATHLYNDLRNVEMNERVNINNQQPKIRNPEPPEMRFIKTPRRNTSKNSLSRYGSWGYMMLGMLMCSVVLLMCGIWECIRRVQKNDVLEQFNNNGEPMETMSTERDEDNNCPQYDPPPPYSSLFPLAKDFCTSTSNSDNSAPPSIYFTASSAAFLPSAPSSPNSIEAQSQLPQNSQSRRTLRVSSDNSSSSPA